MCTRVSVSLVLLFHVSSDQVQLQKLRKTRFKWTMDQDLDFLRPTTLRLQWQQICLIPCLHQTWRLCKGYWCFIFAIHTSFGFSYGLTVLKASCPVSHIDPKVMTGQQVDQSSPVWAKIFTPACCSSTSPKLNWKSCSLIIIDVVTGSICNHSQVIKNWWPQCRYLNTVRPNNQLSFSRHTNCTFKTLTT